ncbi:PEP-CTERM sorting domain-containing protein [Salinisphaera hydrothermalis]|uniref:PEP-CTERM sorting domain-containing protein n=1 Tax=Salinisphaera hydrothermalis TaxID=563188 RepID=UPI00333E87EF
MKNMIANKARLTRLATRTAVVALCLGVAPMALAQSTGTTAPDGAGYLLSYGSNYYKSSGFQGGGIGGYSPSHNVPEPATWGMFGLGLAMIGVGVASRRRLRSNR